MTLPVKTRVGYGPRVTGEIRAYSPGLVAAARGGRDICSLAHRETCDRGPLL